MTTEQIRRLPDLVTIAKDMSDLFGPDDCQSGETIVRKGKIWSRAFGAVECVFAYCGDAGISGMLMYIKVDRIWMFHSGGSNRNSLAAIKSVLAEDTDTEDRSLDG